MDELNLKNGARVMLIFNVDVSDLLCNGATGAVLGVEQSEKGSIKAVIVKFDNPAAGEEARRRNPMMTLKYPGGTVIKKKEQDYSLARNQGLISSTAKLIQFPIVLAWAVTVHKFQGQTVKQPQKVVIDLRSVFEPAQAYVMASRIQELEQLYILEELPQDKIYASHAALGEIGRLIGVSKNQNPSKWEDKDDLKIRVIFLNCRSMKNKFEHIKVDKSLLRSDLIILTETWLEQGQSGNEYQLENYNANLSNKGRGKGLASYFNNKFKHSEDLNSEGISITKLTSDELDVIGIYKSKEGNMMDIKSMLEDLINEEKTTIIGGDLNVCVLKQPTNYITKGLEENGFRQIVTKATHIEGGLIDHVYIKQGQSMKFTWVLEDFPKYYSDHDGLGLTLWQVGE